MSRRRGRPEPVLNAHSATTGNETNSASQNAARDLILVLAAKPLSSPLPAKKIAQRSPNQIRYRTAFQTTIGDVLRSRGWKETDHDLDWDIIWADASWIRDMYDHVHLESHQRVNHFRNHYELTRKDLLVKNLKRAKRLLIKEGFLEEAQKYDFCPKTFNLPAEYSMFVEEFKKAPSSSWIMKPIARSQGKGIFLFQKLSDISDWRYGSDRSNPSAGITITSSSNSSSNGGNAGVDGIGPASAELYIVQQYISNPYLVGGKKFDMRVYVLVTSYSPLTVYLYRTGFARFSTSRFSMSNSHLQDNHIHLTNVAIQKSAPKYDPKNGGKWPLRNLKLYLMGIWDKARIEQLFYDMELVIIRSLLAVRKVMINDKHSFELYGYDLLFDDDLKVWLLEVNAYPSLSANTTDDYRMKFELLDDMLNVIDLERKLSGNELQIGAFDLIYRHGLIQPDSNSIVKTYLGCHSHRRETFAHIGRKRSSRKASDLAKNSK